MAKKHQVLLLLGSNIPFRSVYLQEAKLLIENEIGSIIKQSSIYESEPWGFFSEGLFLNQVLIIQSGLPAMELLNKSQKIEKQLGRIDKTDGVYSSRTIDIDILYFDQEIINEPQLKIPHPYMHERRFTLVPLVEVVPRWIHPLFKKSSRQLLDECPDRAEVWEFINEKINDEV